MKASHAATTFLLVLSTFAAAQTQASTAGYSILGSWHFEDSSASVVLDSSPFAHQAQVSGTSIVQGVKGMARNFNGAGDYILIPPASSSAFNFRDSVSFTIALWIKTTQSGTGMIIRRGLAPVPGFLIAIENGKIRATIGNRGDGSPPDTLLHIASSTTWNDGLWHRVRVVRDRSLQQLHLYIDGLPAAPAVSDPIHFDLVNVRPFTMGRWENPDYPDFFAGTIDEVEIVRGAFHGDSSYIPQLAVRPWQLDFGRSNFPVDTLQSIRLTNIDPGKSLQIDSIRSSTASFIFSPAAAEIPPGDSLTVAVHFAPAQPGKHSGILSIYSSDRLNPVATVTLHGEAWGPLPAAQIMDIEDVSGDYGSKVRVRWYRSLFDDNSSATPATEYSLWKRIPGNALSTLPSGSSSRATRSVLGEAWEFVAQIPAARFTQYAYLVSTDGDSSSRGIPWLVLAIATHLANDEVLLSNPDSGYSVYSPWVTSSPNDPVRGVPSSPRLHQNFPNPFNPSTTITYELPVASEVKLSIYDILGREVAALVDEKVNVGTHRILFDASGMTSGTYFCRLNAGGNVFTRKMLLVR